jgi:hypothetical protein
LQSCTGCTMHRLTTYPAPTRTHSFTLGETAIPLRRIPRKGRPTFRLAAPRTTRKRKGHPGSGSPSTRQRPIRYYVAYLLH